MALINEYINNLNGGVSQQPYEARYSNQVEEMINFIPTVAQGLRRRNPVFNFKTNIDNSTSIPFVHSYNRGDGLEEYIIMLTSSGIKVFDADGNKKTVNGNSTLISNWSSDLVSANKNFKMLTVGDTTFILNKNKTTAMKTDITPTIGSTYKAFYWVKRSFDNANGGGYTYYVNVNGTQYSTNNINSETVAEELKNSINTNSGSTGISAMRKDSIVMIYSSTVNFTFSSGDSWGDQASFGWQDKVAKISDLPNKMSGFAESQVGTISVTGTDKNEFNNYYLKWDGDVWAETVAEGILYKFDEYTLPDKLVRESDGTFTFSFIADWANRIIGDDENNPIPSFIGNKISNMFFYKNRLGFTSGENVILSEVGGFFNFFSTTAMDILDSDMIDVSVDSDTVANIRNVNSTAGALTLWSDKGQFMMSGGEVLSPTTVRVSQTSSYDSDSSLSPLVLDNEIIFFNKNGANLEVGSFSPASVQDDRTSANSISSHIPTYITSNVDCIALSSATNIVLLLESGTNILYAYRYHIQSQQRVLSSWFKLQLPTNYINMVELNNILYMFKKDELNNISIDKIELEPIDIDNTFLDYGTDTYLSSVVMSKYNAMSKQGIKAIREPFYTKNVKLASLGKVDLDIINSERQTTRTIKTKHNKRRIFVGGNSEKINIGFSTSYDTGCQINSVSIEGIVKQRSKNISNI